MFKKRLRGLFLLLRHLLKEIQRKDYKKNKDNGKEVTGVDKSLEKMKDYVRNEKQNGQNYDLGRQNIKKINEINLKLEMKMLFLA